MNPTPIQEDEQLRDAIWDTFSGLDAQIDEGQAYIHGIGDNVGEIIELIKTYSQQISIEARVDEWKTMGDYLSKADKLVLSKNFLDLYRIHGEGLIEQLTNNQSKEK